MVLEIVLSFFALFFIKLAYYIDKKDVNILSLSFEEIILIDSLKQNYSVVRKSSIDEQDYNKKTKDEEEKEKIINQ